MKKKSHANAPDKMNFSVAMTKVLAAELKEMAKDQGRNRNAQINWLLRNEIERWKAARTPSTLLELSTPAGMKKEKPLFSPSPDIVAGASTVTKKRITPNTNEKSA